MSLCLKKIAENGLGGIFEQISISLYKLLKIRCIYNAKVAQQTWPSHHFTEYSVNVRIWAGHNGSAKMKNSNTIKWPFSSLKIIVLMLMHYKLFIYKDCL